METEPPPKTQKFNSGAKKPSVKDAINEAPYDRYTKPTLEGECARRGLSSKGTKTELEKRLMEDDMIFGPERAKDKLEKNPEYRRVVQERDNLQKERDELIQKPTAIAEPKTTRQSPTSVIENDITTIKADPDIQRIQRIHTEYDSIITGHEKRFREALTSISKVATIIENNLKIFKAARQTTSSNTTSKATSSTKSNTPSTANLTTTSTAKPVATTSTRQNSASTDKPVAKNAVKSIPKGNDGNASSSSQSELDSEEEPDWSEDGIEEEDLGSIDVMPEENLPPQRPKTVLTVDNQGRIEMYAGAESQVKVMSGTKGHETGDGITGGHVTVVPAKIGPIALYLTPLHKKTQYELPSQAQDE